MKVLKMILLLIGLVASSFIALFVYFAFCDLFEVQPKHPIQFTKKIIASTIQPLPFKYNPTQLLGPRDNNKVGIRNDVYTYITSNPKLNEDQKKAMFHESAIFDKELDFTQSNENVTKIFYQQFDFMYCYTKIFHGKFEDIHDLQRIQLNTIERMTAYLKFNAKGGGFYKVEPDRCDCLQFLKQEQLDSISCERKED